MAAWKAAAKVRLLLGAVVLLTLAGAAVGYLRTPRQAWQANLPGRVQLAVARMLEAPAVRYRGSVDSGLVSFDVTMTEHGEGYGTVTTATSQVEVMLVDGVTLVKGDKAFWDGWGSRDEDVTPFPDEWIHAPTLSPVDLTALTPTAVADAVVAASRGDVQLRLADLGWGRDAAMTFTASSNGTTLRLVSPGRLTQITGRFGRLGDKVRLDVAPVDHAAAMATYQHLVRVAQQPPGYIDRSVSLTVVSDDVSACGPESCAVRVTVRNTSPRVVHHRVHIEFYEDASYTRYITGCIGGLPAAQPGATVSGGCAVNDGNWRRWVYEAQPRTVYYAFLLVPRVTSVNPPRQPTP